MPAKLQEGASCGFALVAKRTQNRIQDCYNQLQRDHWHCSSLLFFPPWSWTVHSITHSPPLCWWSDLPYSKQTQNVPRAAHLFLSPVLPSGTLFLSLRDMLTFCLPLNHSWRLTFSPSPAPVSNCLQPASSKDYKYIFSSSKSVFVMYTCVRVGACIHAWLLTNVCLFDLLSQEGALRPRASYLKLGTVENFRWLLR